MSISQYILLAVGLIIVAPILAFLCMKLGTFGFYRGKEAFRERQNEFDNSDNKETEN